jgi:hypothetical protein
MIIDTCVVSSTNDPYYLDFFPVVHHCWKKIGIRCLLALILRDDEPLPAFPSTLIDDIIPIRIQTKKKNTVHVLSSQIVRLFVPATLKTQNAVIISDIDLVPMNADYFHQNVKNIPNDTFVSFRDILLSDLQLPMCFNAATPSTWATLTGVSTMEDLDFMLDNIAENVVFDGIPGGLGWYTDQQLLYTLAVKFRRNGFPLKILNDADTGFNRLDRADFNKILASLDNYHNHASKGLYTDFHMPRPYSAYKQAIDRLVDL